MFGLFDKINLKPLLIIMIIVVLFNDILFAQSDEKDEILSDLKNKFEEANNLYNSKTKDLAYKKYLEVLLKIDQIKDLIRQDEYIITKSKGLEISDIETYSRMSIIDILINKDLKRYQIDVLDQIDKISRNNDDTPSRVYFIGGCVHYLDFNTNEAKRHFDLGARYIGGHAKDDPFKYQTFCAILDFLYFYKEKTNPSKPDKDKLKIVFQRSLEADKLLNVYLFVRYNQIFNWQKELSYSSDVDYLFIIAMKKKLKDNDIKTAREILIKLKETHKEKDIFYYLIEYEYNKIK